MARTISGLARQDGERPVGVARGGHNGAVSPIRPGDHLETDRLVLRGRRSDEAAVYRQLWTERDPRVPAHRRVDTDGRPTVEDIAAWIDAEAGGPVPRLLAVERKAAGDVIGYCGLTDRSSGPAGEPELAFELLRAVHGNGYATEAGQAVVAWADESGIARLWAGVWDWNVASRRVLAKLGFRETGQVERTSVHGQSLLTVREANGMRYAISLGAPYSRSLR